MTCRYLIEYLKEFDANKEISCVNYNPQTRERYEIARFDLLVSKTPCFLVTVSGSETLDEGEDKQERRATNV
jgi:hypothetical protein